MAECKCTEMDKYEGDIETLSGTISPSITEAIGYQKSIDGYLGQASASLTEGLAFNTNAVSVSTNLEKAGQALAKAESEASAECADESSSLGKTLKTLKTEDDAYHAALAEAAKKRLAAKNSLSAGNNMPEQS